MELREAGELPAWFGKTGQIIGGGAHIWLARACIPAVTRSPKNLDLGLSANG